MPQRRAPDALDPHARLPDIPGMPMQVLSAPGLIVDVNDAYCRLLRRTRSELIGQSPAAFTHDDDRDDTRCHISSVTNAPHQNTQFEKRYLRGDGTTVWVRVTAVWLPAQRRAVAHVVDLTDMVCARDTATAAHARLAALVAHSSNQILVLDNASRVKEANPAAQRLIGARVGQDSRTILTELVHPDDLAIVLAGLADAVRVTGEHKPVNFRLANRRGGWVHLEAVASNQLDNPAVNGIVINARDVSERVSHLAQTEQNLDALIESLGRASEFRDPYTAGHQQRVAQLAVAIATDLGVAGDVVDGIRLASLVHDIGKLALPAEILSFPGPLTALTFELIKTHSQIGHDIVAGIPFRWPIAQIILQHHERLDGSGYPHGLLGTDILIEAQIVAVADVFEAMVSHRPYRAALGQDAALAELHRGRDSRYHAQVVDACTALVTERRFHFTDPINPGASHFRGAHNM